MLIIAALCVPRPPVTAAPDEVLCLGWSTSGQGALARAVEIGEAALTLDYVTRVEFGWTQGMILREQVHIRIYCDSVTAWGAVSLDVLYVLRAWYPDWPGRQGVQNGN